MTWILIGCFNISAGVCGATFSIMQPSEAACLELKAKYAHIERSKVVCERRK